MMDRNSSHELDDPLAIGDQSEGSAQRNVRGLVVRKATAADYNELADLANLAGGDTLSFIAKGIDPTADARLIYRDMIASPVGLFSYQNCFVAELIGSIVGLANGFPAKAIENERIGIKLTAREEYLEARTRLNDPHSYLLNNIAVDSAYHRRGVGTRLLEAVVEEARQQYFSSITLHVWRTMPMRSRSIKSTNNNFVHPMHVHGGPFEVVAIDGVTLNEGARYQADTVNVGPGQRYDVIWTARKPGKWLVHCHIPHHTANNNVEQQGGGGLMLVLDVK